MQAKHFVKEFIAGEEKEFDSAHASTVIQTEGGTILASWFGGSWEGGADVAIWLSRRGENGWETPRKVADIRGIPMWNPVLFQRKDGTILLFFKVGKRIPDWKTWVMESHDEGRSFTEPAELVPGDEVGGRGPVKNKPIRLSDQTVLAPASLEGETWDAFVDISKDDGKTWQMSELVPTRRASYNESMVDRPYNKYFLYGKGIIQPTLWESSPGNVHMLLRSTSSRIFRSDSVDGGRTWGTAYDTGLPNNNSGIDLTRTENGDILLVYNPRENLPGFHKGPRTPLCVAVSKDNGEHFEELLVLEDQEGNYCYPAVICNKKNEIMITYTWNRKTIVFCRFEYESL